MLFMLGRHEFVMALLLEGDFALVLLAVRLDLAVA